MDSVRRKYLFDLVQATASNVEVFPSPRPQFLEQENVLRTRCRGRLPQAPAPVGGPKASTVLAPAAGPRFFTGIVLHYGVLACHRNFLIPEVRPCIPNTVLEARCPGDHGLASSGPRVPLDQRGYLRVLVFGGLWRTPRPAKCQRGPVPSSCFCWRPKSSHGSDPSCRHPPYSL